MTGIEKNECDARLEHARGFLATIEELGQIAAGEVVGWGLSQTQNAVNRFELIVPHREDGQPDDFRCQAVVEGFRSIGVVFRSVVQLPADIARDVIAYNRLPASD
jgi:hypothetical protein